MEAVDNAVIEIGHNTLIGYCPSYSPVIEIGDNKKEYSHIKLGKIDLLDICKRLEKLEEENDKLREKLNALWYAPGNPGFVEAEQNFHEFKKIA